MITIDDLMVDWDVACEGGVWPYYVSNTVINAVVGNDSWVAGIDRYKLARHKSRAAHCAVSGAHFMASWSSWFCCVSRAT